MLTRIGEAPPSTGFSMSFTTCGNTVPTELAICCAIAGTRSVTVTLMSTVSRGAEALIAPRIALLERWSPVSVRTSSAVRSVDRTWT